MKKPAIKSSISRITIPGRSVPSEEDVLGRCIVGSFSVHETPTLNDIRRWTSSNCHETPTLNDIRRWTSSNWSTSHGVNVYGMNDSLSLWNAFQEGGRTCAKRRMELEEAKDEPTMVVSHLWCWPDRIARNWVWIRLLELPVDLWSQTTFQQVGDMWRLDWNWRRNQS